MISDALQSGLQGLQKGLRDAQSAASDIARAGIPAPSQEPGAASPAAPVTQQAQTPDLTESLVELRVSEYQAKASAGVIRTADEVLGTLIDTVV